MSKKMTPCKACGADIAKSAKTCPKCGAQNKPGAFRIILGTFLLIIGILLAIGNISNILDETTEPKTETSVHQEVKQETGSEAITASTKTEQKEVGSEEKIPIEYKNALIKAKSYSDIMHMSKAAIYDQLISEYGEKFPEDAAQYAMDNIKADWNENALKKAESYAETMHMSKEAIYDQLVSEYGEQFTKEEAQYAYDNIEADWNANALVKAKSYQETMSMSTAAIYDQLVSEYGEKFTAEQAQYAIDNLN